MKKIYRLALFVMCFISVFKANAQEVRAIQFSGVVVSTDSLDQVPYVRVVDKSTGTGTLSDYLGYFNMIAKPGDTILFSAFGYESNSYVVPDTLTEDRYSIIHLMVPEVFELPEVEVYPWPSKEQFAKEFVEMDPYGEEFRQFQQSLSGKQVNQTGMSLQMDTKQAYNYERELRQTQIYSQGITPINNLLNPISWAKFIESWKNGQLQRE